VALYVRQRRLFLQTQTVTQLSDLAARRGVARGGEGADGDAAAPAAGGSAKAQLVEALVAWERQQLQRSGLIRG
jgi:hypothetical protein